MESERETRKRRIDPHLEAAGWTIVPFSPTLRLPTNENLAIEEYPTADTCQKYGVPFFFKQWGGTNKSKTGRTLDGKLWNGMPEKLNSRSTLFA